MSTRRRVQKQPAYVLIRRPFSESSLIVDAVTRDYGRIALLAKGARRLKSPYRGLLQGFLPLSIGWSGRRDLVTLTRAEAAAHAPRLSGRALLFGCYANELLVRFLQRGDPHEDLFDAYERLIEALGRESDGEWSLRLFEIALLRDIGYGLLLEREAVGQQSVEAGRRYLYVPDRGPLEEGASGFNGVPVHGETLLALRDGVYPDALWRREARQLTRTVLGSLLEGRELKSRLVYRQMFGAKTDIGDS
ncbi:MAG: DNA repair protein RecO [Proteobacteria bacterium]|nr:MAG: DNA repair protein RecO [Pseudomonadota bacterium]